MTSLQPRSPYTKEELAQLYPKGLQLQLVQVLLRHGERSPVSARFRNAGVTPFWPYCASARRLSSTVMTNIDASSWDKLEWRRRLETLGANDDPTICSGPGGEVDSICNLGELTDKGRQTTLALGQRLRHLYVDQLGFMPRRIGDADMIYLRATPVPRAQESMQQAFWGMYPASARLLDFRAPTMITRSPADETLYPNDGNCRRFSQLSRAFAQRTADRWNQTKEMDYLNKLISRWMPEESKRVAVDSHPRLSGIMDTMNSTLAHGPATRLPKEFYDPEGRAIIERIGVEEWFSGYRESEEYRTLGIGSLLGDVVSRMVGSVEDNGRDGMHEVGGGNEGSQVGQGGERNIRFGLSGCHDTTLAAVLTSLGAFGTDKWPPYTSHIALELFRKGDAQSTATDSRPSGATPSASSSVQPSSEPKSFWSRLFGRGSDSAETPPAAPARTTRRSFKDFDADEKKRFQDYYVRIRYNDRPMLIPGCQPQGKHLDGDESFCTLAAFKEVVDKFTPVSWKQACVSNLDKPAFPSQIEPAGV
ncbi:MAG: hypothetical protein M1815_004477 [Lichina confinis]|nr:MAG: hypothetical protein M1815_004477 [Lichina confinis]